MLTVDILRDFLYVYVTYRLWMLVVWGLPLALVTGVFATLRAHKRDGFVGPGHTKRLWKAGLLAFGGVVLGALVVSLTLAGLLTGAARMMATLLP